MRAVTAFVALLCACSLVPRAHASTQNPTGTPSQAPSRSPTTGRPSWAPDTACPTTSPTTTTNPTKSPTKAPTNNPTTGNPTSRAPTSTTSPTVCPTYTFSPTDNPTSANPTVNPTLSPTSQSPTSQSPTSDSPTMAPSSAAPSLSPITMNPTSSAPSESPTIMEYPKNRYDTQHEPDGDGDLWTQTITNGGEVIWQKMGAVNVTNMVARPRILVETPVEVEVWKRNRSTVIRWRVENISPGGNVKIQLFREHFHDRQYVRTIIVDTPMVTSGTDKGSYTWQRVWVDPVYSIDTFFLVRVCWLEQSEVCGNSKGVFRIRPNTEDQTHIPGSTGLVGTSYEWERINAQINHDPAEGYNPNSLNKYF